jgi:polysaccharide chain length determinant protein (PEP-CTERM system associated)
MKDLKSLTPVDYVRILWHRRWIALATFVVVTGATIVYALQMQNIYRSEAKIAVEPAAIPQEYVRSSDRSTPEEQFSALLVQLQGRTFLEGLIQEFGLFGYGPGKAIPEDAVKVMSKSIQVVSLSRSTCEISFSWPKQDYAQLILQRIVDSLKESSSTSRQKKAEAADKFLDSQLQDAETKLKDQEKKIEHFKSVHLGELPEQGNANLNVLNGLNSQLIAAENALQEARDQQRVVELRAQSQSRLGASPDDVSLPATASKAQVLSGPAVNPKLEAKEAELAALLSRYTPSHPDVVRVSREVEELKKKSAAELSPISEPDKVAKNENVDSPAPQNQEIGDFELSAAKIEADTVKNEIAKREKERAAIQGQIKAYQAKLNMAPEIEQEWLSLSREYDVLKQEYGTLTGKKFQAQMTTDLETNGNSDTYKVIDEPNLPDRPAFPNRRQLAIIGVIAGCALGMGLAFGRELLDTTIGSEDEATAVLGLPVLVTVSEIPKKSPIKLIGSKQMQKSA